MKMQNALFGFERFPQMTGRDRIKFADKPNTFSCDKGDGIFVVYDLGKETAGYLTIDSEYRLRRTSLRRQSKV